MKGDRKLQHRRTNNGTVAEQKDLLRDGRLMRCYP